MELTGDEVLSWSEWLTLDMGEPAWLIPGILERGGGGMVHGASRAFKSFFLLRLCLDLAAGLPVMDIWPLPRPYRTLLLQAEGSKQSWRRRMLALREHYPEEMPFWSRHSLTMLLDSKEGIEAMDNALSITEPDLVVVDPLANFFSGSEMDEESIKRWIRVMNQWREKFGCAVVICAHDRQTIRFQGKGGLTELNAGMEEARGRTNLPAWSDFVAGFKRKGDSTTMSIQKVREQADGQEFHFSLQGGRLILTGRSDAIEAVIFTHVNSGKEWWLAQLSEAVAKDANVSARTARRAIEKMVEDGQLNRIPDGMRFKIVRGDDSQ